jgi:DNA gyrase/topoisomerase IV subunit B
MWIFVNALVENPAFDSQTKECLTLRSSAFGSKCDLSEEFVKKGWSREMYVTDGSRQVRHHRERAQLGPIQAGPDSEKV